MKMYEGIKGKKKSEGYSENWSKNHMENKLSKWSNVHG